MTYGRFLTLASLVLCTGCATSLEFKSTRPALYTLESDAPGLALVDVDASTAENQSPYDTAGLEAEVTRQVQGFLAQKQPAYAFTDATSSDAKGVFDVTANGSVFDAGLGVAARIEHVAADLASPLRTAINVMQVKFSTAPHPSGNGKEVPKIAVQLAFTTWTKAGELVKTEVVRAEGEGMSPGAPTLSTVPHDPALVDLYRAGPGLFQTGFGKGFQPEKADELFSLLVRDAVGVHLFPYFDSQVTEKLALVADGALKGGADLAKAGKYDEAIAAWSQLTGGETGHAALYDIAVAQLAKGDVDGASAALAKAIAARPESLYTKLRDTLDQIAKRRRALNGR